MPAFMFIAFGVKLLNMSESRLALALLGGRLDSLVLAPEEESAGGGPVGSVKWM